MLTVNADNWGVVGESSRVSGQFVPSSRDRSGKLQPSISFMRQEGFNPSLESIQGVASVNPV